MAGVRQADNCFLYVLDGHLDPGLLHLVLFRLFYLFGLFLGNAGFGPDLGLNGLLFHCLRLFKCAPAFRTFHHVSKPCHNHQTNNKIKTNELKCPFRPFRRGKENKNCVRKYVCETFKYGIVANSSIKVWGNPAKFALTFLILMLILLFLGGCLKVGQTKNSETAKCETIEEQAFKDKCYSETAVENSYAAICDKISEPARNETCIYAVAAKTKNAAL